MFIEKSPFYHSKNSNTEKLSLTKQNFKKSSEHKSFGFLRWIKGAINPLQNLPLISGIYSSINSENNESDRDMVQNGLGGFLYGGPIGAIVGVGNWIFNKLFDNTPTEMFFEFTGISKIWKKKKKTEVANLNDKKEITKKDELIHLQIRENETNKTSRNIVPESTKSEKNYKNSKILNNTRSIEFNYPEKNYKEKLDKLSKSENFSFTQIHSFYKTNNNLEKIKNSFKINA
tara:strand:- start:264 stop:956 length:693 start_codon:yes stop_codon:yes gene_type:complete